MQRSIRLIFQGHTKTAQSFPLVFLTSLRFPPQHVCAPPPQIALFAPALLCLQLEWYQNVSDLWRCSCNTGAVNYCCFLLKTLGYIENIAVK